MKRLFVICFLFCITFQSLHCSDNKYYTYKTSFKHETLVLVPSSILLGYSIYKDNTLIQNNDNNHFDLLSLDNQNFLDKHALTDYNETLSEISDYLLYLSVLLPYSLNFNRRFADNRLENNFIITETFFSSLALTAFSKTLFMRKRPYTYNSETHDKLIEKRSSNYSFFSGHSTLAFTGAVMYIKMNNAFYPDRNNTFLNCSAILLASSVASLRYFSANHFPTDIFTGVIVGSAIAIANLEFHKVKRNANI